MCVAVFLGGLKIEAFSYPFNTLIPNNYWISSFLALIWIGLCTASTKFLDGHDGLVASISAIAFINIAIISSIINQPLILLISLFWAASCLGFLPKNLPNATVYLGEGASQVLGFMIGVLSIISGAKIATSFSIIGWFVLDVLLVFGYRIALKQHPFKGDRKHWHFRLTDIGFAKWEFLCINWIILGISTAAATLLSTQLKVIFLVGVLIFLILLFLLTEMYKWRQNNINNL
jgi:UDP-GlcNAc:undecaprenyl-phosphate/decaprenyl-phosphate GlcNAc-1-phosphate transferase